MNQNLTEKQSLILAVIAVIISIILVGGYNYVITTTSKSKSNYESISDSLIKYKLKDSSQLTKISLLETDNANQLLQLKSDQSDIIRLQELVKQYKSKLNKGSSATIVSAETDINSLTPNIITITDTVDTGSIVYVYPTYLSKINMGEWVIGTVESNKDSTNLKLKINNDYDVIIGSDRKWFKRKNFAQVINHNPYTNTTSLRSYRVSLPRPKKFGIGAIAGYGVDYRIQPRLFIGIGLSYNLIRF